MTFYDPVIIINFFSYQHCGPCAVASGKQRGKKANVRRAAGRRRNGSVTEQKPEAEE